MKLSHSINKYYLIEIEDLFNDLYNENFFVDTETFLAMFSLAGNENMNSLFEFNVKEAREAVGKWSGEEFIQEKYLKKRFINRDEIDYSANYIDELNRLLFTSVIGRSLSMTIYYIFLGANINARVSGKCILENSRDFQTVYLFFQVRVFKEAKEKRPDKIR